MAVNGKENGIGPRRHTGRRISLLCSSRRRQQWRVREEEEASSSVKLIWHSCRTARELFLGQTDGETEEEERFRSGENRVVRKGSASVLLRCQWHSFRVIRGV